MFESVILKQDRTIRKGALKIKVGIVVDAHDLFDNYAVKVNVLGIMD